MPILKLQGDKDITITTDQTMLSASLKAGLPHTNACGGNGKCSTCRVRVVEGLEHCTPRNNIESSLSTQRKFSEDIRLACQTCVTDDVMALRLVRDEEDITLLAMESAGENVTVGEERELALFFSDLRGFTSFSEQNVAYDVVHILNKYFHRVGPLIEKHGGIIDKYMGDGIMAMFGCSSGQAVLNAVRSSLEQLAALKELNIHLEKYYGTTLSLGIGIHFGKAIVGNVGFHNKFSYTAIGDTVNVAARVESANKEAGTELLISQAAYEQVKDDVVIGKTIELPLKGKTGTFVLFEVLRMKK